MSWWRWNRWCRDRSLMPEFAHETDFLYWQMEALMMKYSLRSRQGWEGPGKVSVCSKHVALFSPDDLLSCFEKKPVSSFILRGIPLKFLLSSASLLSSSKHPELSPATQTMLSCLQKREKTYKSYLFTDCMKSIAWRPANINSSRFPKQP